MPYRANPDRVKKILTELGEETVKEIEPNRPYHVPEELGEIIGAGLSVPSQAKSPEWMRKYAEHLASKSGGMEVHLSEADYGTLFERETTKALAELASVASVEITPILSYAFKRAVEQKDPEKGFYELKATLQRAKEVGYSPVSGQGPISGATKRAIAEVLDYELNVPSDMTPQERLKAFEVRHLDILTEPEAPAQQGEGYEYSEHGVMRGAIKEVFDRARKEQRAKGHGEPYSDHGVGKPQPYTERQTIRPEGPIPQVGQTLPTDSPAELAKLSDSQMYTYLGEVSRGLSRDQMEDMFRLAVALKRLGIRGGGR